MVVTVLDGEWSVYNYIYTSPYTNKTQKRIDGTPYYKDNKLVFLGLTTSDGTTGGAFFEHKEIQHQYSLDGKEYKKGSFQFVQEVLDRTKLLVGHNLKADLQWVLESGFNLPEGIQIFDTMTFEYVVNKGIARPKGYFSLKECCDRRGVKAKLDILKDYFDEGYNTDEVPVDDLYTYGMGDIFSTAELFNVHKKLLKTDKEIASTKTILKPMNEFTLLLTDMERSGWKVDKDTLDQVEEDFIKEKKELEIDLHKIAKEVMGDSPINLNSPECVSQIVFGYKILDKPAWVEAFNIGTEKEGHRKGKPKYKKGHTATEIKRLLNVNAERLRKTKVKQCERCKGVGTEYKWTKEKRIKYKTKPDKIIPAQRYKKPYKCKACLGEGVYYEKTKELAGLGVTYFDYNFAAEGGFSTGKDEIEILLTKPINDLAKLFLSKLSRYNSVSTYLNNFIGAINREMKDSIVHMQYNQCITATGRLSSTFHNLPRGNTFPVKKAVVSRWEGGKILDCDFGQLEFRTSTLLSQCPVALKAIAEDMDVHMLTRQTLLDNGFVFKSDNIKEQRQQSKSRSFLPLFGGQSGTPPEVAYFKYFLEYFYGIDEWQKSLGQQAIETKQVQTPSGRIYKYPYAKRLASGRISGYPTICNYTVQGFSFDIVMVTMLELWRVMKCKGVKSKIILTVHDSITCDVYPGETKIMVDIYKEVFDNVPKIIEKVLGVKCNIPFTYDLEIGNNWMEKEEVK